MSEILQSGQHPDADQLSAFVERALPAHEYKQTLAHLAVCADCRTIVSLSLPPLEDVPEPQRLPMRRPWFTGWNLAWPAGAACAALILLVVAMHHGGISSSSAPPRQVAESHVPEPPASIAPPAADSVEPLHPRSANPQGEGPPAHNPGAVNVPVAKAAAAPLIGKESVTNLPLRSRDAVAGLPQPQPVTAGPQERFATGAASGMGQQAAAKPERQRGLDAAIGGMANSSMAAAAPPAPPTWNAATVEVTAAPPLLNTEDAMLGGTIDQAKATTGAAISPRAVLNLAQARTIVRQHPLPSGLAMLSVVANAHQVLAIDTGHALFLSNDDGLHWKPVPSLWQGRAVSVELAPSQTTGVQGALFGGQIVQPAQIATAAAGSSIAQPGGGVGSTLAGTVTDATGAAISGASITVTDAAASTGRTVKADSTGRYVVDNLAPGDYRIQAFAPGFVQEQRNVTLAASQQALADITLPVGQASESVTVESSELRLKKRPAAKAQTNGPVRLLFEITTDTGERWVSADGQTWTRK